MKKKNYRRLRFIVMMLCLCSVLCSCQADAKKQNTLASWNDASPTKAAIIEFVEDVTDKNSENFVPVENRIATFDMDGTIVAEKSLWLELAVAVYRIDTELSGNTELVAKKDELLNNLKQNPEPDNTGKLIEEVTGEAFEGMAQEEFIQYMNRFMQEDKSDMPNITYEDSFYKPMLELISYLQENDFTVYIVSGSERGVVWGAAKDILDLPRSQMIGADMSIAVESKEGDTHTMFEPGDELIRELGFTQKSTGNNKVYNIFHQIGIQPILACGNTDGDFSMLNYVKDNPNYRSLAILINHDDAEREYQYNTDERDEWDSLANQYGWHVVSMKEEFDTIFLKE